MTSKLCAVACFWLSFASMTYGQDFDRSQFTIMVVPYVNVTNANESTISRIAGSNSIRYATDMINKAFLDAGYQTIDFVEEYERQKRDRILDSGSEGGIQEKVMENAPTDVIAKFEMDLVRCSGAGECDMKVRLQIVDKFTAQIYAACQLTSQCRRSCDTLTLLRTTLEVQDGGVQNCINTQFDREYRKALATLGRSIEIQYRIKEGSTRRLDEDCDDQGYQINDCIEDFSKTLAKGGIKVKSKNGLLFICQMRVPLVTATGQTNNSTDIARQIRMYIRKLNPPKGKQQVEELILGPQVKFWLSD